MSKVCILLSSFNGEKFIMEQLESLSKQRFDGDLITIIRDDGSNDSTVSLAKKWAKSNRAIIYPAENVGPAKSFFELIRLAPDADYYAFCDQDDVWDEDKIASGIEKLKLLENKQPNLYFSNATCVNKRLKPVSLIHTVIPNLTLAGVLVCNPALGCTMVFNKSLYQKVKSLKPRFMPMHDKFLIVTSLVLGSITYDHSTRMLYRQHESNVVGKKGSFLKKISQTYKLWFKAGNTSLEKEAAEYLELYGVSMMESHKKILKLFAEYRNNYRNKIMLLRIENIMTTVPRANRSFVIRVLLNVA